MLIEAHIPYCLHLPNGTEVDIDLPDKDIKARVAFAKIWTQRAQEDGVPSDETDFYMEDAPTYFNKSTMIGPKVPLRPEEGWDQYFTGRNIERMKDQNGTFRYTKLFIEFEPKLTTEQMAKLNELTKGEGETLLEQISENALCVVNRIIDCYRYITKQEYIERLGSLSVNSIYFKKENWGFYRIGLVPGIETATMNRSKKEIDAIEKLLSGATPIPLYELLVLDSHSALERKALTLAVVESFQALEIMLENYLIAVFESKGVAKEEYEEKMDTHWKTKERLNLLLKETKGCALNENAALWDPWHTKYDKVRNEVIHQGKSISAKEAEETMKANEAVIVWVQGLP